MVSLLLDATRLEIALTGVERGLAFRKNSVLIERSQIERVQLTEDAWTWLRGRAHPGTHIPRVVAMGTWTSTAGDDFVLVRRFRAGVVIDLTGHPDFERVVLTTGHGFALVQALQRHVAPAAKLVDVEDLAAE